jgi:hypothetical protein
VFVLSIDKNHLASAVKGFYGSEQIESHEYLRRFIDLEYSIPKPSTKDFTNYLFLYFGFNDFFSEPSRRNNRNLNIESTRFILITELLLSKNNVSLRVQEKIFAHTRLTLCSFQKDTYIFPELLFFLVYLKLVNKDYYSKIENNELSFAELSKIYGDIMVSENVHIERSHLVSIEAQLIWFYNNNREGNRINLNEKDDNGNLKFSVKSKFASLDLSFAQFFENMLLQRHERLPLNYLINKINLTESVNLE